MIICHRVNRIATLKTIPARYGVEIDVRWDVRNGKLYLHHDVQGPGQIESCDHLEDYLEHFRHRFVVFNIKDTGTEQRCIDLAAQFGIPKDRYFLLDVEFPYIFAATRSVTRSGERKTPVREIAIRYSEAEPIEQALMFKPDRQRPDAPWVEWVWIDTNTKLPLDERSVRSLGGFKTCLVCPERWGRAEDIEPYAATMKRLQFRLDAVMTALAYAPKWESSGVVKDD